VPEWTLTRRGDGTWDARREDGTRCVVLAATDADGVVWVHAAGEVSVVRPPERARRAAAGHGHALLEAPMPAQVTAVLVAAGDTVVAGAALVLLEAMKMELPLRAPTAGRIGAVHCAVGDRVAPGRVLVDIEPGDDA
jgi:biotin carboxyl carrier protein